MIVHLKTKAIYLVINILLLIALLYVDKNFGLSSWEFLIYLMVFLIILNIRSLYNSFYHKD